MENKINRFGFRKLIKIDKNQINFKIFAEEDGLMADNKSRPTALKLCLSDDSSSKLKNFDIVRGDWEKLSGEEDFDIISNIFKKAQEEFEDNDDYRSYKNKANKYLIKKAIKFIFKE